MTNVTTNPTNELTLNTLRRLALMQHLGEDFFILDGIAYEGDINEATQDFDTANQEDDSLTFADYCADNFTEVDELEEDDYSIDYLVLTDIVTDKDGIKNYLINTAMGAYMADELKLIAPAKLNSVLVKFEDATNNYETSVSSQTTEITAIEYFVGKYFNIAPYPSEKACKCIGIEFTDNNL